MVFHAKKLFILDVALFTPVVILRHGNAFDEERIRIYNQLWTNSECAMVIGDDNVSGSDAVPEP
jgi:hypothetical protein